ncbi:MAG TPA: sigma-70 family RNA polymerase sigma factor, partial [Blastocatellia bacterium]
MTGEVAETLLMTKNFTVESADGSPVALLIERAKAGEREAFDQIMIRYQRKVVSTAWRMLGNEEDARDAAQEAFLRVYKYLDRFRADEDFAAWLYRIVVNACRDIARKRARREHLVSLDAETEQIEKLAASDDVELSAIRSQEQSLVASALGTLTKKEREALILRDLEGLTTEEVARLMGSTQTTVRSHVSSARTKIREFRNRVLKRRK